MIHYEHLEMIRAEFACIQYAEALRLSLFKYEIHTKI